MIARSVPLAEHGTQTRALVCDCAECAPTRALLAERRRLQNFRRAQREKSTSRNRRRDA